MTDDIRTEPKPSEPGPNSHTPSIWRLVSRQTVSIVPFNESGNGPAIYCVHAIAGDVGSFQDIADALRPNQRFFGIQVPRGKMHGEFCTSVQDVAAYHVDAVARFQPDGPVILAGWSVGAIIALEMAQQLTASGRDVPLLIALDGAPCNSGAGLRRGTPRYLWEVVRNFPGWLRSEIKESSSLILFVRRIVRRANERLQTTFPSVRSEQTLDGDAVLRVLGHQGWRNPQRSFIQGLFQASRRYVPSSYSGKVIVYEATVQPVDHLLQVGSVWRKIAPHAEVVRLNGNHESIFRQPDVAILAEHLLGRVGDLLSRETVVEVEPSDADVAVTTDDGSTQVVAQPMSESAAQDKLPAALSLANGSMADDHPAEKEVWAGLRLRSVQVQSGIG